VPHSTTRGFQGASLSSANLRGALLSYAQLQGAEFGYAELTGTSFDLVCAWRADARSAPYTTQTWVALPKEKNFPKCEWTAACFAELEQLIAEEVPEGKNKRAAMKRIELSLDPTKTLEGEDDMANIWAHLERYAPTLDDYRKSVAKEWRETGCAAEGAPYVLHALITRLSSYYTHMTPITNERDLKKALAVDFLDKNCAGAHGLSEADKTTLKKFAAPAAAQAPKP
jgi:hypothetical protein